MHWVEWHLPPSILGTSSAALIWGRSLIMARLLLVLGAALSVCHAVSASALWEDLDFAKKESAAAFKSWVTDHAKEYITDVQEYAKRLTVFQKNVEFIGLHNSEHPENQLGLNAFADLTFEEFKDTRLGFKPELASTQQPHLLGTFRYAEHEAPASQDWVAAGAVTPIKDQGQCGSCWAFSTTGSLEGVNYIKTGTLKSLSEQELVDCDREQDMGCGGGLMNNAFEFIIGNKGVDTENDYHYWGSFSFCNRRKEHDRTVVEITGYEKVPANDEAALEKAVANQPVAVAVCVDAPFQFYKGGIVDRACCTALNHGVLVTGYGVDDGKRYWTVKNSWGSWWGEDGFFRLKKDVGGEGTCGVAMMASYPVKDDTSNPPVPTVCDAQLFSLYECPPATKCQCSFNIFGLLCLTYDCVPKESLACGDTDMYCDSATPVCDLERQRCFSADRVFDSPMVERTRAVERKRSPFARANTIQSV